MSPATRIRVLILFLLVLVAGSLFLLKANTISVIEVAGDLRQIGSVAPFLLGALCAIATVLLVPLWLLATLGSFALGFGWGALAVGVGNLLGSAAAFLISRKMAREWVESKIATSARLQAIDRAAAIQGPWIVFLTRLSPMLPSTLLNYVFGGTRIGLGAFLVASTLGMVPLLLIYCAVGSVQGSVFSNFQLRDSKAWIAGVAITLVTVVFIGRVLRQALRKES